MFFLNINIFNCHIMHLFSPGGLPGCRTDQPQAQCSVFTREKTRRGPSVGERDHSAQDTAAGADGEG